MRAFVVADAHGRHDLVRGLLDQEGLVGDELARAGTLVVQIGDLVNCVSESVSDDVECLEQARDWFDVYLVGNHEHPYFDGPGFSGFWRDPAVGRALLALDDMIRPSVAIDGVLVTHAGLTVEMAGPDRVGWETAEEADVAIRAAWEQTTYRGRWPVFAAIGRSRGGLSPTGGILWSDWSEPKTLAFSQVVGHTPGREPRWNRWQLDGREGFAVCIDVGAKNCGRDAGVCQIAGAWITDGVVEVATYTPRVGVS